MKEVLVATFPNEIEARMLASLLGQEGILSVVKPRGYGYGISSLMSAFVSHSVYVSEENAERAERIAQDPPPGPQN